MVMPVNTIKNLKNKATKLKGTNKDDLILGYGVDQETYYENPNSAVKEVIVAGSGNDMIYAGAGNDNIKGDAGNDWIAGGSGADIIDGGTGTDIASYENSNQAVNVNLKTNKASGGHATGDQLKNIEGLAGSVYDDTLAGSSKDNTLYTMGGNDTLTGNGGNDVFIINRSEEGGSSATVTDLNTGDAVRIDIGSTLTANNISHFVANNQSRNDGLAFFNAASKGATIDLSQMANSFVTANSSNSPLSPLDGPVNYNVVTGSANKDSITTSKTGQTLVFAGAGNDVVNLVGAYAAVLGQAGSDKFVLGEMTGFQQIADFNSNEGDVIDVSKLNVVSPSATLLVNALGKLNLQSLDIDVDANAGRYVLSNQVNADFESDTLGTHLLTGRGDDNLEGGSGNDVLWAGAGEDRVVTGEGSDKVIVVGDLSTANAEKLQLINSTLLSMTGIKTNFTNSKTTEVAGQETIIFDDSGLDELHAFGTVDLSDAQIEGDFIAFSYSKLILKQSDLLQMKELRLKGTSAHEIVITDDNGVPLSDVDQTAAFNDWLDQDGQQLHFEEGATAYTLANQEVTQEQILSGSLTDEGDGSGGSGEIGGNPGTSGLTYDIGNGDRNGDGVVDDDDWVRDNRDYYDSGDLPDDDLLFDDSLNEVDDTTEAVDVLIGDRLKGFGGVTSFTPGVTALAVPNTFDGFGDDEVDSQQFEVYYGTYDSASDIFTVTSTPGTTDDPTVATHTMILYDNDPNPDEESFIEGLVFTGVYAEEQWYINNPLSDNATLNYATIPGEYDAGIWGAGDSEGESYTFSAEDGESNVIFGTGENEAFNGGEGIDIIYAGAGNDVLFGGIDFGMSAAADVDDFLTVSDWLYGEAGTDYFMAIPMYITGIDVIKDFNASEDKILLPNDFDQVLSSLDGPFGTNGSEGYAIGLTFVNLGDLTTGNANIFEALASNDGDYEGLSHIYQFTHNSKSYIYYGDNTVFEPGSHVIIEITGYTGTLDTTDFLTGYIR